MVIRRLVEEWKRRLMTLLERVRPFIRFRPSDLDTKSSTAIRTGLVSVRIGVACVSTLELAE